MTSLACHLPSLLFFSFLLCFTNGNSAKPPNHPACPSFDCGNGIIIGYPFWHQGRQFEYCGYPGFNISCNDLSPVLQLFNNDYFYAIKNISYSDKSLTLTYTGLKDVACPSLPQDFPLNTTLPSFFNYTFGNIMMYFFYNCTLYPPSLPHIECLQYGAKRSYVFKDAAIPEFDWHRYCQSTVLAPVLDRAANEDLVQALQGGFKLTWKQPTDERCPSCETNGGFCGYNNGLPNNFFCICRNGSQSLNCQNNITSSDEKGGVASTAQEANYVAIGVILLGGLVILATAFYFIYKKKRVGPYKPV